MRNIINTFNKIGISGKIIQGGQFLMGGECDFWEDPSNLDPRNKIYLMPHHVELSGFYVSDLITWSNWKNVIGIDHDIISDRIEKNPDYDVNRDMPIEYATFVECIEFCKILSQQLKLPIRLISEAEWEYCAKNNFINFEINKSEWCHDYYGMSYYQFIKNAGNIFNPLGPDINDYPDNPYRGPARSVRMKFQNIDMEKTGCTSIIKRSWAYSDLLSKPVRHTHACMGRFRIVYPETGSYDFTVDRFIVHDLNGNEWIRVSSLDEGIVRFKERFLEIKSSVEAMKYIKPIK